MRHKLSRTLLACTLAAGLTLAAGASANAATYTISGETITLVSDTAGLEPGNYRISICSKIQKTLSVIPYCATAENLSLDAEGRLTATVNYIENTKDFKDVHSGNNFNCMSANSCEILVVRHRYLIFKDVIERTPFQTN